MEAMTSQEVVERLLSLLLSLLLPSQPKPLASATLLPSLQEMNLQHIKPARLKVSLSITMQLMLTTPHLVEFQAVLSTPLSLPILRPVKKLLPPIV